jgi:hypothetical protein
MLRITGTCKTCGYILRLPAEPLPGAQARLDHNWTYPCPGGHRAHGRLLDNYAWDWIPTGSKPSDVAYGRSLVTRYGADAVLFLGIDRHTSLGIKNIFSVIDLERRTSGQLCDANSWYLRHDSPRRTTRFYVKLPRRQACSS